MHNMVVTALSITHVLSLSAVPFCKALPSHKPFNLQLAKQGQSRAEVSYSLGDPGPSLLGTVSPYIAMTSGYFREHVKYAHSPPQDFEGFLELLAELAHACYPLHTLEHAFSRLVNFDILHTDSPAPDSSEVSRRLDEQQEHRRAKLKCAAQRCGTHGVSWGSIVGSFEDIIDKKQSVVCGDKWTCLKCGTVSTCRWLDLGADRGFVPHPLSRCSREGCGRALHEQQTLQNEVEALSQELWVNGDATQDRLHQRL